MIHVGGHPLQAVHQDLDHGTDIFIDMLAVDAVLLALGHHGGQVGRWLPIGHRTGDGDPLQQGGGPGLFLELVALLDQLANGLCVEVHIGDGSEQPLDGEAVDLFVTAQLVGVEGQGFQAVQQQILQGGHIGLLATDT